jgi:hypothetical protein
MAAWENGVLFDLTLRRCEWNRGPAPHPKQQCATRPRSHELDDCPRVETEAARHPRGSPVGADAARRDRDDADRFGAGALSACAHRQGKHRRQSVTVRALGRNPTRVPDLSPTPLARPSRQLHLPDLLARTPSRRSLPLRSPDPLAAALAHPDAPPQCRNEAPHGPAARDRCRSARRAILPDEGSPTMHENGLWIIRILRFNNTLLTVRCESSATPL